MNHAIKSPRPGSRPGKAPRPGSRPGRFSQHGVTLFELLLVLFVAAFVAVAVATIYNRVNTTYKENALFNDVQQLAANYRSLYGGQGNFEDLDGDVAINAGIAPSTMTNTNNEKIHAFSNSDSSWDAQATNNNEEFQITISNLPTSAVCNGMATKGLNTVNEVQVGGEPVTSVSTAVNECSGDGPFEVTYVYN